MLDITLDMRMLDKLSLRGTNNEESSVWVKPSQSTTLYSSNDHGSLENIHLLFWWRINITYLLHALHIRSFVRNMMTF